MNKIVRDFVRRIPDEQLRQPPYYGYVPKVNPKLVQDTTFRNILLLLVTCAVIVIGLFFSSCGVARAEEYTNEEIAQAIFHAENSVKYPYGIKSVNTYGNKEYAHKICLNTIRNNRKRFAKQSQYKDFIAFLGSRFCPTNIPNEYLLNKNWVKNVKQLLKKARG